MADREQAPPLILNVQLGETDIQRVSNYMLKFAAVLKERDTLREALADAQRRYQWCANELLACDYGDNPRHTIGWRVYGWRDRTGERRIYGDSIDIAIDGEYPATRTAIDKTRGET